MTILEPWHWRSLPLDHRKGSEVFQRLFLAPQTATRSSDRQSPLGQSQTQPTSDACNGEHLDEKDWRAIATLLESPASHPQQPHLSPLARFSICAGAPRQLQGSPLLWTPAIGQILPMLRSRLASAASLRASYQSSEHSQANVCASQPTHLPFVGGWLGWLGYDLAWEIEQLPCQNPDPLPFPVAFWYEPEMFAVLDHQKQQLWLAATYISQLDQMERSLTLEQDTFSTSDESWSIAHAHANDHLHELQQASLSFGTSQHDYEAAVRQAKRYIHAGDIFQTNLSLRFSAATQANSWDIYRALQQLNPSPFASYWQTPWGDVVSCSPERLVQRRGNQVQTRPIAGTRPRGQTPQHDQQLRHELLDNAKENAEHIMLVDLERNDLGRVCEWGSVQVDELLTIEPYSHVMHLVSNVIGTMRLPYDSVDLIRAMFPGGTITGCPKVRCMEIIEELEPVRRNLFYGSCGYLDWRGDLDLNILIRTLLYLPLRSATGVSSHNLDNSWHWAIAIGQIGAGIVADSEPQREWHESLSKAQAQIEALYCTKSSSFSRLGKP